MKLSQTDINSGLVSYIIYYKSFICKQHKLEEILCKGRKLLIFSTPEVFDEFRKEGIFKVKNEFQNERTQVRTIDLKGDKKYFKVIFLI